MAFGVPVYGRRMELVEGFDDTVPPGFSAEAGLEQWRSCTALGEALSRVFHTSGNAVQKVLVSAFSDDALRGLVRAGVVQTRPTAPRPEVVTSEWDEKDFRIPAPATFFDDVRKLDAELRLGFETEQS